MWYPGEGLTAEGGTLEVRALCKAFDGRTVLSEVSFRLEPGDCLGVVGVNGSGKSTLLRLLARAERPDSGTILFQDRDRSGDRGFLRRGVGYLPQDNELAEELTVAQQLDLWRAACGLRAGPSPALSALMGLEPMLRRPIHQLSGGMRRRVSIAMALMAEPRILLMDEATVGLDADYREALLCWMEEFLARGGIALWCTHQREELERLCTRCLCLQDGMPRWGDQ